jgi:periplasmic divalent cation tolerance protein
MAEQILLVMSTFPDAYAARRVADQIVSERLAACANITAPVQSIYHWKDRIEDAEETMVIFKTTAKRFPALQKAVKAAHPYEVPEIIAMKVADATPEYLEWVTESCAPLTSSGRAAAAQ